MSKKDDKLKKGAENLGGFQSPMDKHYHIHLKGQKMTDTPMHYNDIVKQHGPVSKLESKGFRLVEADQNEPAYSDNTGVINMKGEKSLQKEQLNGSQSKFANAYMPGRRHGLRSIMRRAKPGIVRKDDMQTAAGGQGGDGKPKKQQFFGKPSKEKTQADKQTKQPASRDQSHLPKDMKPKKPKDPKMQKDSMGMAKLKAGHQKLMGKLNAQPKSGFSSNVGGASTGGGTGFSGGGQMKATHGGKQATGSQPTSVSRTNTGFQGQAQSGQTVSGSGDGKWTAKKEYKGVPDKIQQTKIPETGRNPVMVQATADHAVKKRIIKSDLMEKFDPKFQKGGGPKLDPKGVQGMKDAFKGPDIGGALSSAGSWIKDQFSGPNASEAIQGGINRATGKTPSTGVSKSSEIVKADLMKEFKPQFQKGDVIDFAAARKKKESQQTQKPKTEQPKTEAPKQNLSNRQKINQALKTHGSHGGKTKTDDKNKKSEIIKSDLMKEFKPQFQKGSMSGVPNPPKSSDTAGVKPPTPSGTAGMKPPANKEINPSDTGSKGPKLDQNKVKGFMSGFSGGGGIRG